MKTLPQVNAHPEDHCEVCGLSKVVVTIGRSMRVVAASPVMQRLLKRAALFADADAPVVIFGESGTGKEVIARALHANSPRRAAAFVAVNVAALPADLLESELFGHARGAFTGATDEKRGLMEAAGGGTLFLDEIGEMPLPLQAKLLRALQDGEIRRVGDTRAFAVDVRFVCATHRDLGDLVARGQFREDLYYRLKVLTLTVPPLRERREDIAPLAETLLAAEKQQGARFSAAALQSLASYDWPGNVRELSNVIKHGVALARGGEIRPEHLPDELGAKRPGQTPSRPRGAPELKTLAAAERDHVLAVLEACGGSQVDAARVLGIGRNTLWRKLGAYRLDASAATLGGAPGSALSARTRRG
ncbi:MAG: sigma-54-dependent Fis family transcriptional regulator [Deltaproteobacteria bacterium]|nr:sigma-54-dependent Fis family transcriptional regulator [Deltaproteobacteria bacterium]